METNGLKKLIETVNDVVLNQQMDEGIETVIKPVIYGAVACAKNKTCRRVSLAAASSGINKLKTRKKEDLPEYTDNAKQMDWGSGSISHNSKTAKSKIEKDRWRATDGKGASHLADKQESVKLDKINSLIERFRGIVLSEKHSYRDVENKDPHQKHKITLGKRYRDWNELNSSPHHALTPGEIDRLRRYHNTLRGAGLK